MANTLHSKSLFNASCIALITTAMTFAIRGALIDTWSAEFNLTAVQIGWVNGTAFWGFTLAMIFGGTLCDVIGMKNLLRVAFFGHLLGIGLTIMAGNYVSLFCATLVIGISNGMVEAACNPLVTTLFPEEKIKYLNRFHLWFPGGIVIGGLVAYLLHDVLQLPWRLLMATLVVPNLIYGALSLRLQFPKTERVTAGYSQAEMYKGLLHPVFLLMVFCMFLTAATELGTNQWITSLLAHVGVPSILLLVFINGIMAVGRMFAGALENRLAPEGMLLISAIFSAIGLALLSYSQGYLAFVAAAVFAVGICYFWPTMLGFVSEYLPKTGAIGLSIMGGAGMLSVSLILPWMGKMYDDHVEELVPQGYTAHLLKSAAAHTTEANLWQQINLEAGSQTLLSVAVLPVILVFIFGGLVLFMRSRRNTEA